MLHSPAKQAIGEFRKHQESLLPFTRKYLGPKNLDIGCGNGITSLIQKEEGGVYPTLCDVVDMRHDVAKLLPFKLFESNNLPFSDNEFDSSYLQYVLHHITTEEGVTDLLSEALRVSKKVIIVEEVTGERTDITLAKDFDKRVNDKIYPNETMPVYKYYSREEIQNLLKKLGARTLTHDIIYSGSEENGFLETHVIVGTLE